MTSLQTHDAFHEHGIGARRIGETGGAPRAARARLRREDVTLATGVGTSIAQHGELLQGQLEDRGRRRRRFLVSLPCDRLHSTVTFVPRAGAELTVEPEHKKKVCNVAQLTFAHFGLEHVGGSLRVESNIIEGKGYGSSTADCVAAVHAVARAVGQPLSEAEVAELVVTAEHASDNFMFTRAVLFAHREGVVLEELGAHLPRVEVLGIDTEVDGAVYTLDHPPAEYDWHQIECFHTLVAGIRRAVRSGDLALMGRVATASSLINQQFLPKPMFPELCALAEEERSLGVSVAHSGTVLGMLFDPADPTLDARVERLTRALERLGITNVMRFHT